MSPNAVFKFVPFLLVLAVLMTACSGGGDAEVVSDLAEAPSTDADTDATADAPAVEAASEVTTSAEGEVAVQSEDQAGDQAGELPTFDSDFDRVCTTQVGFSGATAYESVAGVHPVVLFEEQDSGTVITASVDLPDGWAIEEDSDFEDNSELAATELIACSLVTERTPNGVSCDLEGDDGTVTLALVDAAFTFSVHEVTTGVLVNSEVIEAASTDCPSFVFVQEGQTEYLNSPTDDQYILALQPFVTP